MKAYAKEILKSEFDLDFKKQIYYSISNGVALFKELNAKNIEIFDNEYFTNVFSVLMTFCINRQFSEDIYIDKNGFKSSSKKVNSFKYMVPELHNGNIIVHVAKVKSVDSLPNQAKYKLECAKNNIFNEEQQVIDLDVGNNIIKNQPYYAIITYSLSKSLELESIKIQIPNSRMTYSLDGIDIKEEVERFKTYNDDKQNEVVLVQLKDSLKSGKIKIN